MLDEATLPDGVALAPDSGHTRTVNAFLGQGAHPVPHGDESLVQSTSKWEQAIQLTVDGLLLGLIIALAAVGLSLIYGTTGLTNFAHGELVTFGALAAWYLNADVGHAAHRWPSARAHPVARCSAGSRTAGLWKPLAQARAPA